MSELEEMPRSTTHSPCCGWPSRLAAFGAVVLVCGSVFWLLRSDTTGPAGPNDVAPKLASVSSLVQTPVAEPNLVQPIAPLSEDERMRAEIVGKWATVRAVGPRDLTMNDDGTAKLIVNIESAMQKLIFGARMVIDIKWHITDGILNFEMVGGEPKNSVEMLKKVGGDSLAYEILELSKDRLLVKDGEGDPDHDWNRVKD